MQEPAAEPKTAVETRQNPKKPLNVNVNANVNVKEKEKDNADVDVKEKTNVKGKEDVDAGRGFVDSLILNDFADEEEYSTCEEGSISDYMQRQYLEEEERKYRYSQSLEEEREPYI